MRPLLTTLAVVFLLGVMAGPAAAAITPDRNAGNVAAALADGLPPGAFVGASFVTIPPAPVEGDDPNPVAVADSPLTGFPASGPSYAIFSTGNTLSADDPNESARTGQNNGGGSGDPSHGTPVVDLVTLRVDIDVPSGLNCLRTDFRFLSEEYDEFLNQSFNDAFVAELDVSDFSINQDASVNAPHNFAFDSGGGLVSVNTAAFSAAEAAGTTYDGATPRLRASTPVSPGRHAVYLSLFDQDDSDVDSAVFLDAMRLSNSPGDACATGASSDVAPPAVVLSSPANGSSSTDATPLYSGSAGAAVGDSGTVTVEVFGGSGTSGSPLQTLSAARSGASWSVEGPALAPGTYTARARQSDGVGNVGFSSPSTFTIVVAREQELPRPVTGKTVNVVPVKGVVTVRRPGGRTRRLTAGAQIPTGSVVDTRRGTVRLFSTGAGGKIQSALFFDGLFRVTQTRGAKPLTDLKLVEKLARCSKAGKKARSSAKRKKRRLWGDGRGSFRTSGRRSAATVSGTKWLVQDDCKGTLTRVARGKVRVRDFKRKKTVSVKAGRSYRAR